jgi:hypothetical protein
MTRTEGGDPDEPTSTTTGTGMSEEFVGRVAGDDPDTGLSGAEKRSRQRAGRTRPLLDGWVVARRRFTQP